jgi:methionyl-tRNA formyltransferase
LTRVVRVALITPAAPAHHQHFCAYLAARHDVVGVIHPSGQRQGRGSKVRRLRKQTAASGVVVTTLRLLAKMPRFVAGWNAEAALADAEAQLFSEAAGEYDDAHIPAIAHHVEDVNSARSIELLRSLEPDLVVCLGGPIYRPPLIAACKTMINFHSGISPLYNGASTVFFAFANGHINLCGGTLMTMSPTVDGGDVLAHYLPAVAADDDPATLFLKTVRGAPVVVSQFLTHVEQQGGFASVRQPPPLFYTRSDGWTVNETQKVRRLLEQRSAAGHVREEEIVRYWDSADDAEALTRMRETLERLLGLG